MSVFCCVCIKFTSWQERESAKNNVKTRVAVAGVVELCDSSEQLFAGRVRARTSLLLTQNAAHFLHMATGK